MRRSRPSISNILYSTELFRYLRELRRRLDSEIREKGPRACRKSFMGGREPEDMEQRKAERDCQRDSRSVYHHSHPHHVRS